MTLRPGAQVLFEGSIALLLLFRKISLNGGNPFVKLLNVGRVYAPAEKISGSCGVKRQGLRAVTHSFTPGESLNEADA
jgi:hypothetical protein